MDERYFKLPDALVDDHLAKIGQVAALVFVVLARHADKDGRCFPGVERIARVIGSKRITVRSALAELVAAGLIERTPGENGRPIVTTLKHATRAPAAPGTQGDPVPAGTRAPAALRPGPLGYPHQVPKGTPKEDTSKGDIKKGDESHAGRSAFEAFRDEVYAGPGAIANARRRADELLEHLGPSHGPDDLSALVDEVAAELVVKAKAAHPENRDGRERYVSGSVAKPFVREIAARLEAKAAAVNAKAGAAARFGPSADPKVAALVASLATAKAAQPLALVAKIETALEKIPVAVGQLVELKKLDGAKVGRYRVGTRAGKLTGRRAAADDHNTFNPALPLAELVAEAIGSSAADVLADRVLQRRVHDALSVAEEPQTLEVIR